MTLCCRRAGAFTVSASGWDALNPRRVWSAPLPLGWFSRRKLREKLGDDFAHDKCELWLGA